MILKRFTTFLRNRIRKRVSGSRHLIGKLKTRFLEKNRFLSIFRKKYETLSDKRKRNIRNIVVGLFGLGIFLILGNVVYLAKVNAMDESLLMLIHAEMVRHSKIREYYNRQIDFKQRIGAYASTGSSFLQPLIPRRYKLMRRFNYGINILLNAYMLFIDFYHK